MKQIEAFLAGRPPEFCLILCVLGISSFQNMSTLCLLGDLFLKLCFGRSLREIMSGPCPLQTTVMGPSIKDESNKGRGGSRKTATIIKMTSFSNQESGQRGEGPNIAPKSRRTLFVVQGKADATKLLLLCVQQ